MIALTQAAQTAVERLCRDDPEGHSFRLFIQHKGCDGFAFGFGMDNPLPVDSCQVDGDALVLITTRVAQLVRGGTLDYRAEDMDAPVNLEQFSFSVPDPERFHGKFYRHSDNTPLNWDLLS